AAYAVAVEFRVESLGSAWVDDVPGCPQPRARRCDAAFRRPVVRVPRMRRRLGRITRERSRRALGTTLARGLAGHRPRATRRRATRRIVRALWPPDRGPRTARRAEWPAARRARRLRAHQGDIRRRSRRAVVR